MVRGSKPEADPCQAPRTTFTYTLALPASGCCSGWSLDLAPCLVGVCTLEPQTQVLSETQQSTVAWPCGNCVTLLGSCVHGEAHPQACILGTPVPTHQMSPCWELWTQELTKGSTSLRAAHGTQAAPLQGTLMALSSEQPGPSSEHQPHHPAGAQGFWPPTCP